MATESDVASMRAKVREIENENALIKSEIDSMVNSVANAAREVSFTESNATGTLRRGDEMLTNGDKTLHYVGKVEEDIRAKVVLYKNIENAYKEIRRLTAELNAQQGNEKVVRRMVIAILDNETQGLISDEVMNEQTEKLYLSTQYFFLSHIMMDLQLRKNGKVEAADRARNTAVKMNGRMSAWVYFIIALKRGDKEEQNRWLDELTSQPMTGAEKHQLKLMTLISLHEKTPVAERIGGYIGLKKVGEIDKEKIAYDILKEYYGAMIKKPPRFKYIDKYVEENESLYKALEGAMNNEEVGAYIQNMALKKEEKTGGDIVSKMFDKIIDLCCSTRAAEINAEIEYNQKIIDAKGVIENADVMKAQEEVFKVADIKLEDCLYEWLCEKERYSGKREVNDFAYAHLRPSFHRAYKMYLSAYRKKYSERVTLDIGAYKAQTTLGNIKEEEANIAKFCEKRRDKEKAAIKNTKFVLFTIFACLFLVAGVAMNFLDMYIVSPYNIVGLIGGTALSLLFLILAVRTRYVSYKARLAADKKCEDDKKTLCERMRLVFGDMQEYREIYRSYDNSALPDSFFLT